MKKKHPQIKYTFKHCTFSQNQDYQIYFTDKNNVNIYTKGIKEIVFEYNNELYELKELLEMNDDSFYRLFNELKNDSSSIIFYDSDDETLQSIIHYKLQITLKFVDEQLHFYIEECVNEIIEDINLMKK